jgi:phosphatidylinositol-3-phosphatase
VTQPVIPAFDHIFVVIMENHSFAQIIGSADAPYINSLAASYGLAADYSSVAHPSLPNYLALTGGSTFGVATDCTDCFQDAPTTTTRCSGPLRRPGVWRR